MDLKGPKSTVDVLTFFQDGKMDPIKFRFNGKVYPVTRISKHWKVGEGVHQMHHFLVESEDQNSFELQFDTGKFTWQLQRVA